MVQQPPDPRMVMGFGGGELLHVGRVVSERLAVECLEMGGGDARQVLDGLNVPCPLGWGQELRRAARREYGRSEGVLR